MLLVRLALGGAARQSLETLQVPLHLVRYALGQPKEKLMGKGCCKALVALPITLPGWDKMGPLD
jgi:hypothetical protein